MLLAYRIAKGRAAEVLGAGFEEADRLAIRLNHIGLAYEAYSRVDAVTRDLCEGFALGVNTWITEHPDRAPRWTDGVHPADVLALMHRYLLSHAPFDYPEAPHLTPGTPSANAWAVGPALSATREPMLVINPHADYESPFQWYEAHLVTRDMNMYGATLFGLPVMLQGHNGVLG
jgi:acyl-homoserine-lactone acylase